MIELTEARAGCRSEIAVLAEPTNLIAIRLRRGWRAEQHAKRPELMLRVRRICADDARYVATFARHGSPYLNSSRPP